MTAIATLDSLINFRDLGGLPVTGGGEVRRQALFRSATVECVTDADRQRLASLGIGTVVDLRRPEEIDALRCADIPGVRRHNVPLWQEPWPELEVTSTEQRAAYLAERYLDLATSAHEGLSQLARLAANRSAHGLLIHCFAGRDRTGVAVALLLAMVGVDDEAIAHDYALTAAAEARIDEYYLSIHPDAGSDDWPALIEAVPTAAIHSLLQGIRARYGSVVGYAGSIGLTAAEVSALRTALTEGAA